jgi:hypothetical protein
MENKTVFSTLFKHIFVGTSFDWINDANPSFNSFYLRCVKTSTRTYVDSNGSRHRVGSVNAQVHHVEGPEPTTLRSNSDADFQDRD